MRLSLKTFGGWGAPLQSPPIQVDTASLSPEEAAQLERLVHEAFAEQESSGPAASSAASGGDLGGFTISCEDGAQMRQLKGRDSDPRPALEALRAFIVARAG
jgi:hypothetical protein